MTTKTHRLGALELKVLSTLIGLGRETYGMEVRDVFKQKAGERVSVGTLYATLNRLEEKGYITSRLGEPLPERGGRARRYFRVQAVGVRAAEKASVPMLKALRALRPVRSGA